MACFRNDKIDILYSILYSIYLLISNFESIKNKTFSFSICNTMVGTGLLVAPWGIQQAGLLFGIFLMLFMSLISFYTAYRVVQSPISLSILFFK